MMRSISISLSPNTEKDDIQLALKLILKPRDWKIGINQQNQHKSAVQEIEEEFKKYLGVKYAISFNSGRSALMAILNSLGLEKGDGVLLQGFTCNSTVNPIIHSGAKPVFVDIDDTINLDPNDLKRKITPQSKAVMVQHNFGWPAQIDEISEIVKQNNLFLIEDCAHSLGAKYKGKFCGTFGDAAFFSFGRDKIISSVFGGMATTNNEEIGERLKEFQEKLDFPSNFWIFQQLLHPILTHFVVLPAYALNQYLGRIIFGFLHKFSILSKGVYKKEKRGETSKYFPKKLPNALSVLASAQFKKLERFNEHRRELAKFYDEALKEKFELPLSGKNEDVLPIFLRYPILVNRDTDKILKAARKRKIYLDDGWRKKPVVPLDTSLEKMEYRLGVCPRAEKIAKSILNLPTHINISKEDAQKIVNFLKQVDEVYPLRGFPSSSSSSSSRKAGLDMEAKEIKNKETWENFLLGCEEKTFLSSWNWGEFNQLMGNKIWQLGIYERGELFSAVLAVKITAKRGAFLLIQHNLGISEVLLKELIKIAKKENCDFIRMAPLIQRNEENNKIFKDLGFRESSMHANAYEATWKLDITSPEEELLKNMRKTTRYLIRQAEKNQDIIIKKSDKSEAMGIYQKLNREVAKRQNFVPFSDEYIKNEFEIFAKDNQSLWIFGKYRDEVAAGVLVIFWSGIGFYHQAASLSKYAKFSIPYLLQWEAIKEAKRRGCVLYDFWGFTDPQKYPRHPWAGPTLFKMGFGGRAFEYVKTQDLPLSQKYWLTFLFEKLRKSKRGL